MKRNYLIFLLVFSFLLFSLPAFADVSYLRTPGGYTIQNPVSFDVSFDDYDDTGCAYIHNYWGILVFDSDYPSGLKWFSEWVASSTQNYLFTGTLPFGEYVGVNFTCSLSGETHDEDGSELEYNGGETIFEVVEAEAPVGYFPPDFTSNVFGFSSELLYDLRVVLYIVIGLALGMGIILFILDLFEERRRK